jgi:hypothetical protein
VRQELDPTTTDVEAGQFTAPTGTEYVRRSTRLKRKAVDELLARGVPLLTYWPGGLPEKTRLSWHDGLDAPAAWSDARPNFISEEPKPPRRSAVATAGKWEAEGGEVAVVLTWHH